MKSIEQVRKERLEISKNYCAEKGWDIDDLTFEQVFEIRDLSEWKDVTK